MRLANADARCRMLDDGYWILDRGWKNHRTIHQASICPRKSFATCMRATPFHEPAPKSGSKLHALQTLPPCFDAPETREAFGVRPACRRFRFLVPMRVRCLEVEASHEPLGRARLSVRAATAVSQARRARSDAPYHQGLVQGIKARTFVSENSHLDPLPRWERGNSQSVHGPNLRFPNRDGQPCTAV